MSSRPIISPFLVITNGNMSGNLISLVSVIQNTSMVSYAVSWTGTAPVGTLSVQVSNDYSQNADGTVRNPGTWATIVLNYGGVPTSAIPISGNSGNGFIDVDQIAAYAIRLIYTAASGTGTLQATINGKVH
jgi:hypothetical protein